MHQHRQVSTGLRYTFCVLTFGVKVLASSGQDRLSVFQIKISPFQDSKMDDWFYDEGDAREGSVVKVGFKPRENIKLLQGNHDLGGMNQREKIGLWAESFEF